MKDNFGFLAMASLVLCLSYVVALILWMVWRIL